MLGTRRFWWRCRYYFAVTCWMLNIFFTELFFLIVRPSLSSYCCSEEEPEARSLQKSLQKSIQRICEGFVVLLTKPVSSIEGSQRE